MGEDELTDGVIDVLAEVLHTLFGSNKKGFEPGYLVYKAFVLPHNSLFMTNLKLKKKYCSLSRPAQFSSSLGGYYTRDFSKHTISQISTPKEDFDP